MAQTMQELNQFNLSADKEYIGELDSQGRALRPKSRNEIPRGRGAIMDRGRPRISRYSDLLSQARATGVDRRTISFFKRSEENLRRLEREAEQRLSKKKSGFGGFVRKITGGLFGGASLEKARGRIAEERAKLEDLVANIQSEVDKAPELLALRRRRRTAVEELQRAGGTSKRGRASLLESQQGGRGFFSRYFG